MPDVIECLFEVDEYGGYMFFTVEIVCEFVSKFNELMSWFVVEFYDLKVYCSGPKINLSVKVTIVLIFLA